ncbi:hypothetical protein [Microbulbifer sp. Q7]|uniref:hypothetical protein n=1 Tax=Microbulbifer sp. Q7 TaxID=1785091 RepID=UPI00082BF2B2|nr:hypothetical protein [Microbulbifer sp. Q7]
MKKFALRSLAAAAALAATSAFAATDGENGVTSEGNLTVNLLIDKLISIGGLDDIDLAQNATTLMYTGVSNLCVGGLASYNYNITFTGGNNGFLLTDGSVNIPYSVLYDHDSDASDGTTAAHSTGFDVNGETLGTLGCDGTGGTTDNAQILVEVDPADIPDTATATNYSDVLTVTVTAL